jgi:hypothetical protein
MTIYPKIQQHIFYSLNLSPELNIIFENLDMININNLKKIIETKSYDVIELIPQKCIFDNINNKLTIFGNKINDKTYMINKNINYSIIEIQYEDLKKNIIAGLEYLYHIMVNLY